MPGFYLLGIFVVKKRLNFFSHFPGYWVIWKRVFSLIYMNAMTADVLCPRLCQLVALGMGEWNKGAGYLGFRSPDPLGCLGTVLQMCAVAPTTVRSNHQLSCCWACPAMGVKNKETHRWGISTSQLGRQGLLSLVLSLHIFRLFEETHLQCMPWWHGEEGLYLLLVSRSLRPAGGDACVSPPLPAQGWVECEFRRWLCSEHATWRCVLGNTDLNLQKMCSGKMCWLKEYIVSREDGIIWNWLFGQIWWHWEQFTNKEAELFWNKVVHVC